MANQIILSFFLITLTVVVSQTLVPNRNCRTDYYIREYHYHKGSGSSDRQDTPSELIPDDMQHEEEMAQLQKELIEEKKKRQKDIHYMLRIVDRLLRRQDKDDDDLDTESKVTADDSETVRADVNATNDLQREWETSTKKFRKDKKKRKEKGSLEFSDPQLRSDQGQPGDPSVTLTPQYDDVTKDLREVQEEVKGLQVRQLQLFRAYKKATMAFKRSTTVFRQTMDKHQRLQMFHTSEVARLSKESNECRGRTGQMQDKLECVTRLTAGGHSCQKFGPNFNAKESSKQIRDVSHQLAEDGDHRSLQYAVTEEGHFDATQFKPRTMTVIVDDLSEPPIVDDDQRIKETSFEEEKGDLTVLEGFLVDDSIDDQNESNIRLDSDIDLGMISTREVHVSDVDSVSNGNQDDVITSLDENDLERDLELASATDKYNVPATSLSVKRLWDILVKAGKSVAMWSEMRQSQKLPKDCSDIDLWSQRWSPKQTVFIGPEQTPLGVECQDGWLLIQKNEVNSSTEKSWDSDSYEIGIQTEDFFWIGNRYLSIMTSSAQYSLRIELETFDNKTLITEYSLFQVSSRDSSFRLKVDDIRKDQIGDILGAHSFNPITEFEFLVPILPVTLPPGGHNQHRDDTYREVTTLRGWWYPRRSTPPNTTTAQTHLPMNNADCFTHLNAEKPFYCDVNGDVINVRSTKIMLQRNRV